MKVGIRTPSIKKSIRARTTGKYKRKFKRLVNPFYGKKGMGWIKNPSRAFKNKIYHKTTISARSAVKGTGNLIGMILYYLFWVPIKWMFILVWILLKYTCLGIAWLFVAAYNGTVCLVEKIVNAKREDAPPGEEDAAYESDYDN